MPGEPGPGPRLGARVALQPNENETGTFQVAVRVLDPDGDEIGAFGPFEVLAPYPHTAGAALEERLPFDTPPRFKTFGTHRFVVTVNGQEVGGAELEVVPA